MAAPLSCPSCWCAVTVPPGHSGPALECPVCGGEVPTPGGTAPPAPPPGAIAVRPVSGPNGAPLPVARVVARPAAPPPPAVAKVKPLDWGKVGADSPPPTRGKKQRNDDDDESSDRRPPGNGRVLVLVGIVAAGLMVLVGLPAVALVWMLSNADPDDEEAAGIPPLADVQPKFPDPPAPPAFDPPAFKPPVFDPPPARPDPVPPPPPPARSWDEGWQTMPFADGVSVQVPSISSHFGGTGSVLLRNREFARSRYRMNLERATSVFFFSGSVDVPEGNRESAFEIAKAFLRPQDPVSEPVSVKVGRYDGEEFTAANAFRFNGPVTFRTARVGPRLFVFGVGGPPAGEPKSGTVGDRAKKFFDSIVITFDPATYVPAPVIPARPIPPTDPRPIPFPDEAPKLVATIPVFTTAVALPERKEMLTFAPRPAPTTGKQFGLVRRYATPDFKLLATYHLPAAVVYAAADEAGGRLVTAAASKPDPYGIGDGSGRSVTPADVLIFDLKKLTDGSLAEKAEVRPTATVALPPTARVNGLELAKDGKTAYVGWNLPKLAGGGQVATSWAGKLQQIDVPAGKAGPVLDLPNPIWVLKRNADGSRVYAATHPFFPTVQPRPFMLQFGVPISSQVFAVDLADWQLVPGFVPVPGPASDLAPLPDGRMLAVIPRTGTGTRLHVVEKPGAAAEDATPPGNLLKQASTAAVTADGKRAVFGAMNTTDGISVWEPGGFRMRDWKPVARTEKYAGAVVAGQMHLDPSGTRAAFHTGQVIDLTATEKPAP